MDMRKIKKIFQHPFTIFIVAFAFFVLCGYNAWKNVDFFEIGIYQVISIVITILIAYALVQFRNDERKQKEIAEKLARQIQELCAEFQGHFLLSVTQIDENCWREMLMAKRTINNKISVFEGFCNTLEIKTLNEDVEKIKEHFEGFTTVQGDVKTAKNEERYSMNVEMIKHLNLINERCDVAILHLYTQGK